MKKYFVFVCVVVLMTSCASTKRGCPMVASNPNEREQPEARLDSYTDSTHRMNSLE